MDRNYSTDFIRQSVSALEAGKALGLNPNKSGRCSCPAHHGKDRNCVLDAGERGYYCHVCHDGGDVIKLVQTVNQCGFKEAVAWLNSTFRLGLNLDKPVGKKAQEQARMRQEWQSIRRQNERDLETAEYLLYVEAGKLQCDLENDAKDYRPTDPDEEWDERFVTALQLLPDVRDLVTDLAMRTTTVRGEKV